MDVRQAAAALGGDVLGRDSVLAPGPGHSADDRSLRVWLAPDGFTVHSYANDDWRACRDHVKARLGLEGVSRQSGARLRSVPRPPDTSSTDRALALWRESGDPRGTLASRYLASRNLTLPTDCEALRFHPSCPFGQERHPSMIGLYRGIFSNEPKAIHRTALTADGQKIDRKALGAKRGCAIKLSPDDEVHYGLAIAEGIETALAGWLLGFRPVWAVGDAQEIATFPVLSGVDALTILVDNDKSGTGQDAARKCSERWTAAGREVFRVVPIQHGADMADVVDGRVA